MNSAESPYAFQKLPNDSVEEEPIEVELGAPQQSEGITIRPPDYPVHAKGVTGLANEGVLQKHFATMLIGRPESGKSHLLYEFITNPQMYAGKFQRIYFVTPLDSLGSIPLTNSPYATKTFSLKWIQQKITEFNSEVAHKYPTRQDLEKRYGPGTDPFNVLFVFDDCVAEIKKYQFDVLLKSLFFNRRHVVTYGCVSLIVTSQYYVELPRSLRANLTSIAVFNCTPEDWKRVQSETLHNDKHLGGEIGAIIKAIFAKPRAFIYIDIEKAVLYYGFNKSIIPNDDEPWLEKRRKIN